MRQPGDVYSQSVEETTGDRGSCNTVIEIENLQLPVQSQMNQRLMITSGGLLLDRLPAV